MSAHTSSPGRTSSSQVTKRIVIIGIGCSGKTILAKHIQRVLPGRSFIVHQDDFAPPEEDVPYSPVHGVQDWDDPPTAILWDEFRDTLEHIRRMGQLPGSHQSHDHLNKQIEVEIDPTVAERWRREFLTHEGIIWFIVDGFILYWDREVVSQLDVKIMLRVPHDLLQRRREERQTYVLQTGGVWVDPPNYFEQIVWPAYVKAHEHLFVGGDVEGEVLSNIAVLSPEDGVEGMTKAFEASCTAIAGGL